MQRATFSHTHTGTVGKPVPAHNCTCRRRSLRPTRLKPPPPTNTCSFGCAFSFIFCALWRNWMDLLQIRVELCRTHTATYPYTV